jgi:putative membrane protein insertion efficiency factor
MKTLLLNLIRFYRKRISPGRPPCCRFVPTCSQYALEAVEKYGALKGGWLALRRLLRCHPFYKGDFLIRCRDTAGQPPNHGPGIPRKTTHGASAPPLEEHE